MFKSNQDVLFPPVGIAHITNNLIDLIDERFKNQSGVEISCSMQPNSNPHIGSILTLMVGFAVGKYVSEQKSIPALVTFDQLENAPFSSVIKDDIIYTRSLENSFNNDGIKLSEIYMNNIKDLLEKISRISGVSYRIRSYSELQSKKIFREKIFEILKNPEKFVNKFSPSDKKLRIRFPCPQCHLTDKKGIKVNVKKILDKDIIIEAFCPEHENFEVSLFGQVNTIIDTNAPIRSVLKACVMLSENSEKNFLSLIVNGNDWSGIWLQKIYCEGMALLGYNILDLPMQIFSPMVLDWSGAKLSKTMYVTSDSYNYLSDAYINYSSFEKQFGEEGLSKLWNEVSKWIKEPSRLFRNYSINYFQNLLE